MRLLVVPMLFVGFACRDPVAPTSSVRVITSRASFDRGPDGFATVAYTVENAGRETVLVARCGDRLMSALDRWENFRWVQYSGDACLAIFLTNPVPLQPGARREEKRGIADHGRYRLRIGRAVRSNTDVRWDVRSNAFEVR